MYCIPVYILLSNNYFVTIQKVNSSFFMSSIVVVVVVVNLYFKLNRMILSNWTTRIPCVGLPTPWPNGDKL